mmetsp:Transcript_26092/g.71789  ORF Transcript_26092/g.71789 Transcript_26092/m.71789 type:complete len:208 (-) Transcript_26092:201-824(-)
MPGPPAPSSWSRRCAARSRCCARGWNSGPLCQTCLSPGRSSPQKSSDRRPSLSNTARASSIGLLAPKSGQLSASSPWSTASPHSHGCPTPPTMACRQGQNHRKFLQRWCPTAKSKPLDGCTRFPRPPSRSCPLHSRGNRACSWPPAWPSAQQHAAVQSRPLRQPRAASCRPRAWRAHRGRPNRRGQRRGMVLGPGSKHPAEQRRCGG